MSWERQRFGDGPELAPLLFSPNAVLTRMGNSWSWRSTEEADRGVTSVPEGKNGEWWRSFAAELQWVVNSFQSTPVGCLLLGMGDSKPLSTVTSPAEGRPYPEVLKSPAASSCLKSDSKKANLLEPMVQKPTWGLPFEVRRGNPSFYAGGACPRMGRCFGESFDFSTLRETLQRINLDVGRCLAWLDLGQGLGDQGF